MLAKSKVAVAIALGVWWFAIPAEATVVDFSPLTNSGFTGVAGTGVFYQEGGLDFTSSANNPLALLSWGTSAAYSADPTGATLFQNVPGESIIVTRTGGGSFFLNSIDLADVFNEPHSGNVPFSYVDGGGSHSLILTLDNLLGLETFILNLPGVTSFTLSQAGSIWFQVDNIVYDAPAVPLPAALPLFASGLGLLGLAGWRRRRKVGGAAC